MFRQTQAECRATSHLALGSRPKRVRPIGELRIGQSVDRKVEDSEIAEGLGFELGFCCVRAEESHAAVRMTEKLFGRYHLLA